MEKYVILVKTGGDFDRQDLEDIQDQTFNSIEELRTVLKDSENVSIYSLDEFMDEWNNMDEGTKKKDRINIMQYWFGYVNILK